jgi:hypothetical protein
MISTALARALHDSGLEWVPATGDAFRIDRVEAESDLFVLSEMTVEAHEFPTGTVLGFNGTTEWALDSVDIADALWMPSEAQLRELLGGAFRSLAARDDGFLVVADVDGVERGFTAQVAADAYARAVLAMLDSSNVADPE